MTKFPDAFLDELRSRLSIVDVVGARVTWDARRSQPARGDYWACCPFHGEKTPSFHVLERRGRFHCFGCHEKGSAIDFVMKMDRLSFPEAVERLAEQAGLQLPQRDPVAAAREAAKATLFDVTEAAVETFRETLAGPQGAAARAYLVERGLQPETIDMFELGLAAGPRAGLTARLRRGGASLSQLVDADLTSVGEAGRSDDRDAYDRFQNRLMFPIRDARGRCVAFGGRDLTGRAHAKYMNSRETTLFSKKHTLYNIGRAREALAQAHRGPRSGGGAATAPASSRLLVAEGYMDVIALWQAGFPAAVAPMGTAITEEQLEKLWRLDPAPVLALDGDEAGLRAASLAARRALTILGPRRSLAFALLPPGQDPDDLLRAPPPRGGPEAMSNLILNAEALVDRLWQDELAAQPLETPEAKADFEQRLAALAELIPDPTLKRHYGWAFRNKTFERIRSRSKTQRRVVGPGRVEPLSSTRRAAVETADGEVRDGVLILSLINHPEVALAFLDDLWELELSSPRLDSFLAALLSAVSEVAIDDRDTERIGEGAIVVSDQQAAMGEESGDASAAMGPTSAASSPHHSAKAPEIERCVDQRLETGACAQLRETFEKRLPRSARLGADKADAKRSIGEAIDLYLRELRWRRERTDYASSVTESESELLRRRAEETYRASQRPPDSTEDAIDGSEDAFSERLKEFVEAEPWIKRRKRLGPHSAGNQTET